MLHKLLWRLEKENIDVCKGVIDKVIKKEGLNDLIACFNNLMVDEKLRGRMGRNGRDIVEEKFTVKKMTSRYSELYKELLKIN